MFSVLLRKKEGFRFYFVLCDGAKEFGGGLTEENFLVCDAACPHKELMLRTLINKCMNDFIPEVKTRGEWGTELARFGFVKRDGLYTAGFDTLKLPHGCAE